MTIEEREEYLQQRLAEVCCCCASAHKGEPCLGDGALRFAGGVAGREWDDGYFSYLCAECRGAGHGPIFVFDRESAGPRGYIDAVGSDVVHWE